MRVLGPRRVLEEDVERARQALEAQDVIPIGRHLDFVDNLELRLALRRAARLGHLDGLLDSLVELDAEFEAQVLELVIGELAAERGEQRVTWDAHCRHEATVSPK
eukprot:jgi/Chrpa1/1138/Chrysochromulina_OHIO_Genome00001387-RA